MYKVESCAGVLLTGRFEFSRGSVISCRVVSIEFPFSNFVGMYMYKIEI